MKFSLVHPSIVDLYISTLSMHLLKEKMQSKTEKESGDELDDLIIEISEQFNESVIAAEKLFGNSDIVQEQLNVFVSYMGNA